MNYLKVKKKKKKNNNKNPGTQPNQKRNPK